MVHSLTPPARPQPAIAHTLDFLHSCPAYGGIVTSFHRMQSSTCAAAGTDDAAVLTVVCLFLAYSTIDLLVHSVVFARRLS